MILLPSPTFIPMPLNYTSTIIRHKASPSFVRAHTRPIGWGGFYTLVSCSILQEGFSGIRFTHACVLWYITRWIGWGGFHAYSCVVVYYKTDWVGWVSHILMRCGILQEGFSGVRFTHACVLWYITRRIEWGGFHTYLCIVVHYKTD